MIVDTILLISQGIIEQIGVPRRMQAWPRWAKLLVVLSISAATICGVAICVFMIAAVIKAASGA